MVNMLCGESPLLGPNERRSSSGQRQFQFQFHQKSVRVLVIIVSSLRFASSIMISYFPLL